MGYGLAALRSVPMLVRISRTVSFMLLFKSIVGFSIAALALFGVTVPWLGIAPTPLGEGAAATAGAMLGAFLALRA